MDTINVLVSLTRGYGLGDAVQMSAVLKHVRRYRPLWILHFQAEKGRESIGRGIAHASFAYGEGPPTTYDAEVQIVLYDTASNWEDRPNTRVVSCLHEKFAIEWDSALARYEVNVPAEMTVQVPPNAVAIHYQGDSAPERKDLTDAQAQRACDKIRELGYTPLLIDWRGKSSLKEQRITGANGGDAAWNCAVISQCSAFIGIDSGPGKCASATKTPSLIVWTLHNPEVYHDPAPNTTHLISEATPLRPFFEANYLYRRYSDLSIGIDKWLTSCLGCKKSVSQ